MKPNEVEELQEFRSLGLSPRQIRAILREAEEMREYIEFLEEL